MSTPMLDREKAWLARADEIKEILKDPNLVPSETRRLNRELKSLVRNTLRSYYEGTDAALPSEIFEGYQPHTEPAHV
jgi:hypothetical protein